MPPPWEITHKLLDINGGHYYSHYLLISIYLFPCIHTHTRTQNNNLFFCVYLMYIGRVVDV